jgi:chemotaxis protein CheX
MKVQLVNPFVTAAVTVLSEETGQPVQRGGIQLEVDPYTTEDVTALIGISGEVRGSMFLSMSETTALCILSTLLGQPFEQFDSLAQSGIAELANVVAGTAATALAVTGTQSTITPPLMIIGAGARLSAVDIQRIAVPLTTSCGIVKVHVGLRDA